MVRQIKYDHNAIVTLPQDNTKEVSADEWNDGHNESGMTGHDATTLTISSGSITPVNDMHLVDGEGAADDDLDTIANTETAEFDELKLFAGSQTITVKHGTDNIFTLSEEDIELSTTVSTLFVRKGTNWYETGSGSSATSAGIFGDGSDGNAIISSNTDLGSSNVKNYLNLTINSGIELTGDSNMVIRVLETLTFGSATSSINVNGKGGAGGVNTEGPGNGGAGGGLLRVFANEIVGVGKLQANGEDGVDGTTPTGTSTGLVGADGINDGGILTAPTGGAPGTASSNRGGAGGGGLTGNGGDGPNSEAGGVGQTPAIIRTEILRDAQGAGGGAASSFATSSLNSGGGGGAGFIVLVCMGAIPAITLEAIGGDGGAGASQTGGAGGGAGFILVGFFTSDSSTKTVTGGTAPGSASDGDDGDSDSIPY